MNGGGLKLRPGQFDIEGPYEADVVPNDYEMGWGGINGPNQTFDIPSPTLMFDQEYIVDNNMTVTVIPYPVPVGGTSFPIIVHGSVDNLTPLAYIGLACAITITIASIAICVKRVKDQNP
jgi:hypothetical protein